MSETKKFKILVVDDEHELVEILSENLQNQEYETLPAYDGDQAIAQAEAHHPDLIISDINMPKRDGLQMLAKLNSQGIRIPVIFVTAFSDTQKMREAWKLGAFDFIEKPIDYSILFSLVNQALEFGVRFYKEQKTSNIQLAVDSQTLAELNAQAKAEGISLAKLLNKKLNK